MEAILCLEFWHYHSEKNTAIMPTHVKTQNILYDEKNHNLYIRLREISHTIYVAQVGCSIFHRARFHPSITYEHVLLQRESLIEFLSLTWNPIWHAIIGWIWYECCYALFWYAILIRFDIDIFMPSFEMPFLSGFILMLLCPILRYNSWRCHSC